jgi:hypothetical protein
MDAIYTAAVPRPPRDDVRAGFRFFPRGHELVHGEEFEDISPDRDAVRWLYNDIFRSEISA